MHWHSGLSVVLHQGILLNPDLPIYFPQPFQHRVLWIAFHQNQFAISMHQKRLPVQFLEQRHPLKHSLVLEYCLNRPRNCHHPEYQTKALEPERQEELMMELAPD